MRTIGRPSVTLTAWPKLGVLEHGQALVVVHRDDGVDALEPVRHERRVCGYGADEIDPFAAQLLEHRVHHVDFFTAQVAAFARVRIQSKHQDARIAHAELRAQVSLDDAQHGFEASRRERGADLAQGQVGGGERHAQATSNKQHHGQLRARLLGQVFGVAGEPECRPRS